MHTFKTLHKYFEQKTSEWNILGFLESCDLEPYSKKIKEYLIKIADTDEDQRRERAWKLQDIKRAKEWEKTRSGMRVHIDRSMEQNSMDNYSIPDHEEVDNEDIYTKNIQFFHKNVTEEVRSIIEKIKHTEFPHFK
ncbi:6736_t:CDS:2 [Funneliformis geosporum]|nr:6736_t:CDS:2 [Funneliformis geosporum]